jgi:NUMOD4 motif/HNH endonuclease
MSSVDYLEEWLPVTGYEGYYEVSNLGRVRRVAMYGGRGKLRKGKLLVPCSDGNYMRVTLCKDNKTKSYKVCWLVMEAFVGPCPSNKEVHHKNKDKTNDALYNLRYLTHRIHRQKHAPKLTREKVIEIRRLAKEGFTQRALAAQFRVSQGYISHLVSKDNREYWRNVQ